MVSKTPNRLRKAALTLTAAGFCCLTAAPTPAADGGKPLSRDDIVWLQRIGFGIDSAELSDYRKLGRVRFFDEQLADRRDETLPPQIESMIRRHSYAASRAGRAISRRAANHPGDAGRRCQDCC
jgi:hypothetical protein